MGDALLTGKVAFGCHSTASTLLILWAGTPYRATLYRLSCVCYPGREGLVQTGASSRDRKHDTLVGGYLVRTAVKEEKRGCCADVIAVIRVTPQSKDSMRNSECTLCKLRNKRRVCAIGRSTLAQGECGNLRGVMGRCVVVQKWPYTASGDFIDIFH